MRLSRSRGLPRSTRCRRDKSISTPAWPGGPPPRDAFSRAASRSCRHTGEPPGQLPGRNEAQRQKVSWRPWPTSTARAQLQDDRQARKDSVDLVSAIAAQQHQVARLAKNSVIYDIAAEAYGVAIHAVDGAQALVVTFRMVSGVGLAAVLATGTAAFLATYLAEHTRPEGGRFARSQSSSSGLWTRRTRSRRSGASCRR